MAEPLGLLGLTLAAVSVFLALVTFLVLARPELGAAWTARRLGLWEGYSAGTLELEVEEALFRTVRSARVPLVLLLFGWSFCAGAVIALSRL